MVLPGAYPLIVIWYLAVLSFGPVDKLLLLPGPSYFLVQALSFYILAAVLGAAVERVVAAGRSFRQKRRAQS